MQRSVKLFELLLAHPHLRAGERALARRIEEEMHARRPSPEACLAVISLAAAAVAPQLQEQPGGQGIEQQAAPSSAVAAVRRGAWEAPTLPTGWMLLGMAATVASHRAHRLQELERQPLPDALQLAALELQLRIAEAGMLRLGAAADAALAAGREAAALTADETNACAAWSELTRCLGNRACSAFGMWNQQPQSDAGSAAAQAAAGRLWQRLPLRAKACVAEPLARLLCKQPAARALIHAADGGTHEPDPAGTFLSWLVAVVELSKTDPEVQPPLLLLSADAEAACSLAQSCCKVVHCLVDESGALRQQLLKQNGPASTQMQAAVLLGAATRLVSGLMIDRAGGPSQPVPSQPMAPAQQRWAGSQCLPEVVHASASSRQSVLFSTHIAGSACGITPL